MNGMGLVIRTIVRLLLVPVLTFGFYLMLHGHVSHGAGFAGGALIALALLMVILGFGSADLGRRYDPRKALGIAAVMLLAVLAVGMTGYFMRSGYGGNFLGKGDAFSLFSGGIIGIINGLLCLAAAGSLFYIIARLAAWRSGPTDNGDDL
jgi:multicomponent Na+:H+ antiporter subunit B